MALLVLVQLLASTLSAGETSRSVDSLLALEPLRGSSWSILFVDMDSKRELVSTDADRLLIPASVTKLWTTAAGLEAFGADHRFKTKVLAQGQIDPQGGLNGNLLVDCAGDASFQVKARKDLGQAALNKLASELQSKGLKRVNGDLIIYTANYQHTCGNAVWEMGDLREGFAPAIDAVGFNSNVCHVKIEPGKAVGDTAMVTLEPPFAQIEIINDVSTATAGEESWIEYNITPCRDELEISGVMARGDKPQYLWFPIQNPAHYFGLALRDALARKGIEVSGQILVRREPVPSNGIQLIEWLSPPLSEIVAMINKDSDNYLAEYLLSAIGSVKRGQGSPEAGLRYVMDVARNGNIHRDQLSLQDGSGLSRQNLMSAQAVVALLIRMAASSQGTVFEASLAQSGVDGTLSGRLSEPVLFGRVRAKTGTMTNVSALAGYIGLDNGKELAFAMICNNYRCSRHYVRTTQDNIIRAVFRAANAGT
ncbi:D-alanyl-D-alanine carboxypeptidase/D-alanyl-D-alanine-endopeptidase [bacterium]|nr:D-alanyl-D-alanine carboxypeptidase/D-alanyl-D-alanine-endopeptidase [bacterium]